MNKALLLAIAIGAAVLVAFGGFWFGRHFPGHAPPASGPSAGDRPIAYWWDPMDPTTLYDGPGKSTMGMDLVPVYEDEIAQESESVVSIDPVMVQNMNVRTTAVVRQDFSRTIRTVGRIEHNEQRIHQVNTKISGWIETLHVNFMGDHVDAGHPLLEIYSPELVSTQQEFMLAVQHVRQMAANAPASVREDAERLLASTRKRLENWDIPPEEIERLAATGDVQKTVRLHAPASGVVMEKNVVEGAYIEAGMNLFQIADHRTVWVRASLFEGELPWIREGQLAELSLSYLPDRTYRGRIAYIYPFLGEEAKDVQVRIEVPNPDFEFKPGMYVNVQLQGRTVRDALVVPTEAVLRSGSRSVAFVVRERGRFEPREVRIGEEGGPNQAFVRILSGLEEGEEVVVSAQFMLDSESRLQEALQKMRQLPPDSTDRAGLIQPMEPTE
jgi:Cu(I)/Ag(I) efflux system membrane fusion protein/cobalt-zinc-cadmium efflux system membrane fusion protein